jgi:hypothetical protein
MADEPKVLIPYDNREAISLRLAAGIANRSQSTLRSWCQNRHIRRRIAGGQWSVSRVALTMLLESDAKALKAYLDGDRSSELVLGYFRRSRSLRRSGPY